MGDSDSTANDPTTEREKLDYRWIAGELEDIRVSMLLVTTALNTLAEDAEPQLSDKLHGAGAILETTVNCRLQNVFDQVFRANLAA